jgi:hypothetical protein
LNARHRIIQVFAIALTAALFAALIAPLATRSMRAAATSYYVNPAGNDSNDGLSTSKPFKTIQKAVDLAQPGEEINLSPGVYLQDVLSVRNGLADARISIKGPAGAVVKGGGNARIFEINHDNITLQGFTIDGQSGDPNSASGYRDKLLYVLGKQSRDGVSGLKVLNMTFTNAGGECIRLRYFAQGNEIADSTIVNCGIHDFRFNAGGKNGEGIYIGTAPEQRADGKNPTTDPDESNGNWIHDNTFNTQGNECVDIKESATGNIVERNQCTGQHDPESGGLDSRGSGNVFRSNEIYGNIGAGIRLGGDTAADGIGNDVYANTIRDNQSGGIKVQRQPQGQVCGNTMANNAGGDTVGSYPTSIKPTAACAGSPPPRPTSTAVPIPTSTTVPAPTKTPAPIPTSTPRPTPTSGPVTSGCGVVYAIDGGANTFIEAERSTHRGGRFQEISDSSRSAGAYMAIPGSGMQKDAGTFLSFDLSVTGGTTFYVWLLGYGSDGSTDSFFVQADGGTLTAAVITQGSWKWKRVSGVLALADGQHTLKISDREDGARIDKLLLTQNKSYVPTGQGGAALTPQCR